MKKVSAILLSLALMWLPTLAVAQAPLAGAERAACACCDCGQADCCVAQPSSGSTPAPATPTRATFQNELSTFASTSVAWTLPAAGTQASSPSASSLLTATGVPLFTQHCALLL